MTATAAASTHVQRRNPWWTQLWIWVLIAMGLGIALGIVAPDLAARMGLLGDAFIKLIRMLIAPIIFCTVVTGIARMADMARVGRVAIKASSMASPTGTDIILFVRLTVSPSSISV